MTVPGPGDYSDETEVELLGRRVRLLELSREVSTTMPVYPGHVGVAFWDHLTHEQVRRTRLPPDSPFRGYVVRGIVGSEHVSTHVDAIWHFNPDRPDLTIDKLPWEHLITPAAWIDVSDVPPREHIRLDRVRRALDDVEVTLRPGMTLLYYTGVGQLWDEPFRFLSEFPGLDREASEWLLDQGLVNVATDAVSTDTLADLTTRTTWSTPSARWCTPRTWPTSSASRATTTSRSGSSRCGWSAARARRRARSRCGRSIRESGRRVAGVHAGGG